MNDQSSIRAFAIFRANVGCVGHAALLDSPSCLSGTPVEITTLSVLVFSWKCGEKAKGTGKEKTPTKPDQQNGRLVGFPCAARGHGEGWAL